MNRTLPIVLAAALVLPFVHGWHAQAATINSFYHPKDYASLGNLNVAAGSITFNTTTLEISGAFTGTGTTALSESGNVELAVFNFNAISIGAGTTVNVVGSRGMALLSKSTLDLAASINMQGVSPTTNTGGAGGPGGDRGGNGGTLTPQNGLGLGGGQDSGLPPSTSRAGGGGYGGVGGDGGSNFGVGGSVYGDALVTDLYGGSGGSAGRHNSGTTNSLTGAGGGGALALISLDTLTLSGNLNLFGGSGRNGSGNNYGGGGGSGGGVLLAAPSIDLNGIVDVRGSAGGTTSGSNSNRSGGGGGGGRIAFYTGELFGDAPSVGLNILLSGGAAGGGDAEPGLLGTFHLGAFPESLTPAPIPEPTSGAVLGFGTLLLLGLVRRRARSGK